MDNFAATSVDPRSAERCRQAIAALPITNVGVAHEALGTLLKAMHQASPPPAEYLSVLESAREPLAFLQDAMAARYASKPLPASSDETAAFEHTLGLWRLMADSYARVAQLGGGDDAIQKQLALVCQRCLHYAGQCVIEYYRARRTVGAGHWLDLHGYFDTADDWGLANQPVAEPLDEDTANVNCATTYAAALLVDLANPYSRTAKELSLIIRWARKMSAFTAVTRPDDNAGGRGYGIDLMLDRGLLPVDHLAATPTARLFNTSLLGEHVQQLLADLKVGQSPASLGLGDCPKAQATRLLLQLYRPWCLAAMPRRFERSQASGALSIAYDPDAVYFHIAGRNFTQPAHVRTFSRSEVETMCTFGSMVESAKPVSLQTAQLDHALDVWEIVDQSLYGFRAYRNAAVPRVEHGQLLALKSPAQKKFVLGRVTWLVLEKDGRLQAGIQVLPNPAAAVSARPTGLSVAATEKYTRGYFLPAVPAQKEPISIVLPSGWFSPGRVIEVFTDRQVSVRLGDMLTQGANFERCTFTLVA
jgi:cyclic-di-GMP-binding protein